MVRLPTTRDDWRLLGRTFRLVLGIPAYAVLAVVLAVVTLGAFSFSQNVELVAFALTDPLLSLSNRLEILLGLYPFAGEYYPPLEGFVLVVVGALTGVDLALIAYHLRVHGLSARGGGGSAVGVALGALGAGCAACGSAMLAGLLSLFGAAGLVTVLPLEGLEFSLVAVLALVLSAYWIAEGMRGGEIRGCPVDPGRQTNSSEPG